MKSFIQSAISRHCYLAACLLFAAYYFVAIAFDWWWDFVPSLGWGRTLSGVELYQACFLFVVTMLLVAGRRYPQACLAAIVFVIAVPARYQVEGEWAMHHQLLPAVVFISLLRCLCNSSGQADPSGMALCWNSTVDRVCLWLPGMLLAAAVYVLFQSCLCYLIGDEIHWLGDLKHAPTQYIAALAAFFVAMRFGNNVCCHHLAVLLAFVIVQRLLSTKMVYRDADVAILGVVFVPICLAVALSGSQIWKKVVWVAFAVAGIAGLVLIANRGAAIGLIFCLMSFALMARRQLLAPAVLIGVAVLCLAYLPGLERTSLRERMTDALNLGRDEMTVKSRLEIWADSTQPLEGPRLWFGFGPGQGPQVLADSSDRTKLVAIHNSFLALLLELGIVGASLYYLPIVATFWMGIRAAARDAVAAQRRLCVIALLASIVGMMACGLSVSRQDSCLMFLFAGLVAARPIAGLETFVSRSMVAQESAI